MLIDRAKHFKVPFLDAGKFFTAADIQAAAKAQGVTIKEGGVVLFHTGLQRRRAGLWNPLEWSDDSPTL